MKKVKAFLAIINTALLLTLAVGCATAKRNQTETMLSAAGFKSVPATTPAQQAHLKTLAPGKVSTTERDGETYFAYPDVAKNVLYLGQQAEYQAYQKLRLQNQLNEEKLEAAEMNNNAWGQWAGWGGGRWR